MCQSLPEITGDGVRACECVCVDELAFTNTGTAAAAVMAYELMNTERYVRDYQSVRVNDDRRHL